jgi:hypothetical protein
MDTGGRREAAISGVFAPAQRRPEWALVPAGRKRFGGFGMSVVRWADGVPEIDAAVAARAMKFSVEYFLRQMQRGAIRGRVERGTGDDEGRHRMSFRHRDRELVMVVDDDGRIISQELIMAAPKPHWRQP